MSFKLRKIKGSFNDRLIDVLFYIQAKRDKYHNHKLLLVGTFLIVVGLSDVSKAVEISVDYVPVPDAVLWNATCRVINFMSTSFGGLMVTASGIIAIVSAAFGAFRAASAMIVAGTTAFILRDLVDLYFPLRDCRFDYTDGSSGGSSGADDGGSDPCIIRGLCG